MFWQYRNLINEKTFHETLFASFIIQFLPGQLLISYWTSRLYFVRSIPFMFNSPMIVLCYFHSELLQLVENISTYNHQSVEKLYWFILYIKVPQRIASFAEILIQLFYHPVYLIILQGYFLIVKAPISIYIF